MTPPPRIVTITGSVADADAADGAILADDRDLQTLRNHRAYRCAVGDFPVVVTNSKLKPVLLAFGSLYSANEESLQQAATRYQSLRLKMNRKLRFMLIILLGIVGAFIAVIALSLLVPPPVPNPLLDRVLNYQRNESIPAVRLAARNMPKHQKELTAIRMDVQFAALPLDVQRFVMDRLQEFNAYGDYKSRFDPPTISPHEIRTLTELDALDNALNEFLMPPATFANAWTDTEAVALRQKWQTDTALLRQHERRLTDWHRDRIRQATELNMTMNPDANWRMILDELLNATPPLPRSGPVPGSSHLAVKHGSVLDAAGLHEMTRVEKARDDWRRPQRQLEVNRHWYDGMIAAGETLRHFAARRNAP